MKMTSDSKIWLYSWYLNHGILFYINMFYIYIYIYIYIDWVKLLSWLPKNYIRIHSYCFLGYRIIQILETIRILAKEKIE
jgi:hypothetical protein